MQLLTSLTNVLCKNVCFFFSTSVKLWRSVVWKLSKLCFSQFKCCKNSHLVKLVLEQVERWLVTRFQCPQPRNRFIQAWALSSQDGQKIANARYVMLRFKIAFSPRFRLHLHKTAPFYFSYCEITHHPWAPRGGSKGVHFHPPDMKENTKKKQF